MNLPVIKADASAPWYADGLRFTCTQCGNCCTGGPGYVWISDVEVQRLADHLGESVETVLNRYCRKVGGRISLNETRTPAGMYDCVFLKEERIETARPRSGNDEQVVQTRRTCTIYPVRPLQCRTWPFWEGILMSQENWDRATNRCPGMDSGKHFTASQIESLRDARDWPHRPPSSADAANPLKSTNQHR